MPPLKIILEKSHIMKTTFMEDTALKTRKKFRQPDIEF